MKNTNDPSSYAFPIACPDGSANPGMTLLEYYMAAITQGLVLKADGEIDPAQIADEAYDIAVALIRRRARATR